MSAEKEIVNYWYNLKGYFTINNLKASNRDLGILAYKLGMDSILHIEVICSISGAISNQKSFVNNILEEKFSNKAITEEINKKLRELDVAKPVKKILVLGLLPQSRKEEITALLRKEDIEFIEFQGVLGDVLENLDTQYYKNDVLRALQVIKYLLLSNPAAFSRLSSVLSSGSKDKLLKNMLQRQDIIKGLRKSDEKEIAEMLKYASVKDPKKFAVLIQESILNRRTRKPFLDALLNMQGVRKEIKKELIRKEKSLSDFF